MREEFNQGKDTLAPGWQEAEDKLYPRIGDKGADDSVVHKREECGLDTGGTIRAVMGLSHHRRHNQ